MSSLPEEVPGQRKDPSSLVQPLCLTLNITPLSGEVYPECGVEGSPSVPRRDRTEPLSRGCSAWASLAKPFPASSVCACKGAGCGSVGDMTGS